MTDKVSYYRKFNKDPDSHNALLSGTVFLQEGQHLTESLGHTILGLTSSPTAVCIRYL